MRHDLEAFRAEMKRAFEACRRELKHDLEAFRAEMQAAFAAHRTAMDHRLDVLLKDMTIRLGGIIIGSGAVVSLLQHFWR